MRLQEQIIDILDASRFLLSDIKPSEWAEANRVMSSDVTSFPGPFRFDRTPYCKEIVDCLSPDHPARIVAVMKGAQIGFSVNVIENGIGWIIAQNPGNILFLSGHQDLAEEAMEKKIDQMIDSCGLRPYIRPNVLRKKNQRTGDTSKAKEFPGGSLIAGSASNHKLLRQRSVQYGFIDDFDSAKKSSKESGNTRTLIQQRFAAYYDKMKLFYISTPELKQTSNIEPVYLLGDQRKYFIPCPCCGEYIDLHWSVQLSSDIGSERAGIVWELDTNGKLLPETVKYRCQKCGDYFDDSQKGELIRAGEWRPTAEPSEPGYYSYHISSLYAPPGMFDWAYYVRQYLEANPPNGKQKEDLQKTFQNLCLGLPYEQSGKENEASTIQRNCRNYEIDTVPDQLSHKDQSRGIVLLTCAADMNGKEDDARLDYEIVAWAKNGSSYSIRQGSIGTFIPNESKKKDKADRERWTYKVNGRSVWPEFEKIIGQEFKTDSGQTMKVMLTGLDCGHFTTDAYAFIDRTRFRVVGVRGDKESQYRKFGIDMPVFKPAKERTKLYMLDVNHIKDTISTNMELKWAPGSNEPQPEGFMNFPTPSSGMYLYKTYFEHFQAEHRVTEQKDGEPIAARWVKKNSAVQNHFWDTYIYNYALKDIWADMVLRANKPPLKGGWAEFIRLGEAKKVF